MPRYKIRAINNDKTRATEIPAWRKAQLEQPDPKPMPSSDTPSYEASDFAGGENGR